MSPNVVAGRKDAVPVPGMITNCSTFAARAGEDRVLPWSKRTAALRAPCPPYRNAILLSLPVGRARCGICRRGPSVVLEGPFDQMTGVDNRLAMEPSHTVDLEVKPERGAGDI